MTFHVFLGRMAGLPAPDPTTAEPPRIHRERIGDGTSRWFRVRHRLGRPPLVVNLQVAHPPESALWQNVAHITHGPQDTHIRFLRPPANGQYIVELIA